MNELNVDLYQVGLGPVQKNHESSQVQQGYKTEDTIGVSQHSEDDARTKGVAIPWLPPPVQLPDTEFSLENIKNLFVQTEQKVIQSILNHWEKGIEQMNEQQRKKQLQRITGELQNVALTNGSEIAGAGNQAALYTAASAFLMIVSTGLGGAATGIPGTSGLEAVSKIAADLQLVPVEFAASLSLGGGVLAAAAFYPALSQAIRSVEGQSPKISDPEFAKFYLAQVNKLVNNPAFEKTALTLLRQKAGVKELDPKAQQLLTSFWKAALLLTSVALYYKVETGWLTGQEIEGLVTGEIKLDADDPRRPVLTSLAYQLRIMPEKQRFAMLEEFFKFFDSKPSVEDLLITNHMLRNFGVNQDYERLTQNDV